MEGIKTVILSSSSSTSIHQNSQQIVKKLMILLTREGVKELLNLPTLQEAHTNQC